MTTERGGNLERAPRIEIFCERADPIQFLASDSEDGDLVMVRPEVNATFWVPQPMLQTMLKRGFVVSPDPVSVEDDWVDDEGE